MARDWIQVDVSLPEKPEVLRIARTLGLDRDVVVAKLIRLWIWANTNSVDGAVDGVVAADVDALVSAPGFAACLAAVDWLTVDDEKQRVRIPNFTRYNGESAKKRALKAERQARWRSRSGRPDASTPASTGRLRAPVRGEERREERKQSALPLAFPEGITEQDWQAFRDHRNKQRKPMTPKAEQLALAKLHDLVRQGYDPTRTLNHAIEAGWLTFFPRDDCRRTLLPPERAKAEACPCGAPGTVRVGGKWRCAAHVRGYEKAAA